MATEHTIALGIAYHGASFHGWQYQAEQIPTVQQAVERALSRVADHPVRVICAGRTDTGVHATRQVVNFTTSADRPLRAWTHGGNAHLPDEVSIEWATSVPPAFDARRSATARRYFYLIHNHKLRSAIFAGGIAREHRPLDPDLMAEAGQALLGEQDFSSFRAAHCQSLSPMRNVHHVRVTRRGDVILVDIQANAFLHHMVRNIVGVLLDIGAGRYPVQWLSELLALKDRNRASMTAPAQGLYLVDVIYPDSFSLPRGPALPHVMSLFC